MVKRIKDNHDSEEVTNWVIGKEFSKVKLMDHLQEVDRLEIIAQYGYENYEENIEETKDNKPKIDYNRINAFKLLVSRLLQIIGNVEFTIRNLKEDMQRYDEILRIIEKAIPRLYRPIGQKCVQLKPSYNQFLDIVRRIKSSINTPLYKNNLIYITKEVYDPIKAKEDVLNTLANI